MKKIILVSTALFSVLALSAQQVKQWTLDECINHAQQNNINVQQNMLNIESGQIALNTSRNSRLPNLNGSMGSNINLGRGMSRDGTYQDNTQISGSVGLSSSVSLFDGFRTKHEIESSKLDLEVARQNLAAARENVALSITSLYLQALYSKEMVAVAENQVLLSREQAERSRKLFESGRSAKSAVYESEALAASDQLSLTQQKNNLMLALLDLSQALNFESAEGFDIAVPELGGIALNALGQLPSIDATFDYSVDNRPNVLAENIKLQKSGIQLKSARSALYPSLGLSAGYSSGVYHSFASGAMNSEFWNQLRNNAYGYAGISLNIPIFNKRATTNQIRQATLAIKSQELAQIEAQRTLRKEIEQAYYNAIAAYEQYLSSEKALESAQTAFKYEQEKMDAGRSTIFDYNDAKNRMQKAEATLTQAKYEFIFRRKIIDFYAGKPITLAEK